MSDLSLYDHTEAVRARLASTGYPVGVAQAPKGQAAPYFVVYPLAAGEPDGSLADPDADWQLPFQVTSVGVGPEQAQGLSDLARATLQATPLTVSGRGIWRVAIQSVGAVDRDDAFQPPLHFTADTVTLQTTPA